MLIYVNVKRDIINKYWNGLVFTLFLREYCKYYKSYSILKTKQKEKFAFNGNTLPR